LKPNDPTNKSAGFDLHAKLMGPPGFWRLGQFEKKDTKNLDSLLTEAENLQKCSASWEYISSRDILLLSTGVRLMRIKQSLRQCLATSIFLGGAFIALFESLNVYKSFSMTSAVDLGEQSLIYGAGTYQLECLTQSQGCTASGVQYNVGDACTGWTTFNYCPGGRGARACIMTNNNGTGACTGIPNAACPAGSAVRCWQSKFVSTPASSCGTAADCTPYTY
jgi:hypothetical protein